MALLLLLVLAPVVARAQGAGPDTVVLVWTAPGDDGQIGTATAYELRMSQAPLDDTSWDAATLVTGTPAPLPSGTRQSTVVRGLTRGSTYWFALKTVDDAGNWSGISNVVRWDWVYDTAPPAAPTGVAAAKQADGSVRVSWAPNSEADLAGYHVYRSLDAGGPYARLNAGLVTATEYVDTTVPNGTESVWYQISAQDDSGNEGARSAAYSLTLVVQATAWAMETGYPNPSPAGGTVRIPVVVPAPGGGAVLEIVNSAGQTKRRIDLGTLAPGGREVPWDGRSDAGREVAPGVYTAWLVSGSTRLSVKLARVP